LLTRNDDTDATAAACRQQLARRGNCVRRTALNHAPAGRIGGSFASQLHTDEGSRGAAAGGPSILFNGIRALRPAPSDDFPDFASNPEEATAPEAFPESVGAH